MSKESAMKAILTRSTLRDIVLFLSCLSALFCDIGTLGRIVGFSILAAGCILHILTKGILVRNVTLSEKGIYRFVRHPYYLSNYLIDSSFCLLSGNPYLPVLYPFLFFWAYGPTLRKEEAYLASLHPVAFARHSEEVPQLFPDRASLRSWIAFCEGFSRKRVTCKECGRIARFLSLGLLIVLFHEIRTDGFLGTLWSIIQPNSLDYDESLIAFLIISLYGASQLFQNRARRNGQAANISQ
jgi:protein-S-isoprenylcysteine O-methyltransferase Ste14